MSVDFFDVVGKEHQSYRAWRCFCTRILTDNPNLQLDIECQECSHKLTDSNVWGKPAKHGGLSMIFIEGKGYASFEE